MNDTIRYDVGDLHMTLPRVRAIIKKMKEIEDHVERTGKTSGSFTIMRRKYKINWSITLN